jgi:hypothetical protein
MTVGMGVELHVQPVLVENAPAQFVQAGGLLLPLLGGQVPALHRFPGLVVPPDVGDDHDVLAADRLSQGGDGGDLGPHGIPGIRPMQMLEHGTGQHPQSVGVELVLQLRRIAGQVAVRSQFDPLVTRLGHLGEEPVRRDLLRIAGEPHTPRVRGGAQGDL